MTKIYCGITEVPKGQVRGSEEECYNLGQVRYYGKKKISKNVIQKKKLSYKKHRKSILVEIAKNRGKIRKLKIDYERHNNPEKKKPFKEEGEKLIADNKKLAKKLEKLDEEYDQKTKSKELSKKSSKKKSKTLKRSKRTGTKKGSKPIKRVGRPRKSQKQTKKQTKKQSNKRLKPSKRRIGRPRKSK